LQLSAAQDAGHVPEYDDLFEFKVDDLGARSGASLRHYGDGTNNYQMNESIRNLNWFGEHIKSNLDS